LKKLFTGDERRFWRELNKLSELYEAMLKASPLSSEEVKFVKEVLKELSEKPLEEFDFSKLKKVVEIADKLSREGGTRLAFEF
jgi:hypothetical protein